MLTGSSSFLWGSKALLLEMSLLGVDVGELLDKEHQMRDNGFPCLPGLSPFGPTGITLDLGRSLLLGSCGIVRPRVSWLGGGRLSFKVFP